MLVAAYTADLQEAEGPMRVARLYKVPAETEEGLVSVGKGSKMGWIVLWVP